MKLDKHEQWLEENPWVSAAEPNLTKAERDRQEALQRAVWDAEFEAEMAVLDADLEHVNARAVEHGLVSRFTLEDALQSALGDGYQAYIMDMILRKLEKAQDIRDRDYGLGLCRREFEAELRFVFKHHDDGDVETAWNVLREHCVVLREVDGEVFLSPPYRVELNEEYGEVEAKDDLWLCMFDFDVEVGIAAT